ncbi:carbonic anhydrase [Paenibacillus tarimensis]|uniref:carbonic anhydrase n=1 Tax=Paenibacillus tarimensis TaxID=416012 RepID=UPI001F270ECE|nr:carbonic anhydrase [Paenibacillus tarimensis]MCF2945389.1 carbonic anhydrase [Paenibacillus tarimensis]
MRKLWGKTLLAASLAVSLTACSSTVSQSGNGGSSKVTPSSPSAPAAGTEAHAVHWSYGGETGPEHWGELGTENRACSSGLEQSPINLEQAKIKADATAAQAIEINYRPSQFTITNNGDTIRADAVTQDNTITLDGKEYTLAQFHFHVPSEHQIDGKNLDMELHFVHKDAGGKLAVVGVLMKAGDANEALAELWSKLPAEKTEESIALDQTIDLPALLPQTQDVFRYDGSLTTPPCSEGVEWTVMQEPIEVSQEQIDAFASIFPDNHRPVQPWNDREVFRVNE